MCRTSPDTPTPRSPSAACDTSAPAWGYGRPHSRRYGPRACPRNSGEADRRTAPACRATKSASPAAKCPIAEHQLPLQCTFPWPPRQPLHWLVSPVTRPISPVFPSVCRSPPARIRSGFFPVKAQPATPRVLSAPSAGSASALHAQATLHPPQATCSDFRS